MRPKRGIATDGAHSMKRGVTRYRAVNLATGELLFEQNIGNQTINIGEFLGVVEAAKYISNHRFSPAIIYTDSLTALTWFNEKRTASRKRNAATQKSGNLSQSDGLRNRQNRSAPLEQFPVGRDAR